MVETLLPLMGLSLFLAFHNVWVWLGRRSESMYLWVGLWCANSFIYQLSRYSQITAQTTEAMFRADRAAFTSAVLVILAVVMMGRKIAEPHESTFFGPVALILGAVVLTTHWTGELFITREVASFSDWFGHHVDFSAVGPLYLPFLIACAVGIHIYGTVIFLRARHLSKGVRWGFVVGISVYLGVGLNDVLLYSGFLSTTSMFEFGFAAVAVALNAVVVRHVHSVQDGLHEAVAERTVELTAALKKARAASLAKDNFLANISHELRTPLNGVIVALEVLSDEENSPSKSELLGMARSSADSLLELIEEILHIARIDTDTFHVSETEIDLRRWLPEILRGIAPQAHKKGLEIFWDVTPDVPQVILGDRTHLRRIFANLIGNAVKFTAHGWVSVEVSLNVSGKEAVVLEFAVADTGPGIAEDRFGMIFERFTQGDESLTRRHGGVGLGLAICKEIIVRLGGQIWVESEPDKGSTFRFTLPIQRGDEASVQPLSAPVGMRLLIVGSTPAAGLLADQLRRRGLQAAFVENLSDCTALHEVEMGGGPEVIIAFADVCDRGDADLVREIRDDPMFRNVKVVVLGGLFEPSLPAGRIGGGPDAYLTRPVEPRTLLDQLTSLASGPDAQVEVSGAGLPRESRRLKVLVADDIEVNRMMARVLLEKMGHEVCTVSDGRQAVEAFNKDRFDVVLMDVQMPVMDGLEATRRIRSEVAFAEQPRVVAVTAASSARDRRRCLDAGMNDFLTKPVRTELLRAVLEEISPVEEFDLPRPERTEDGRRSSLNLTMIEEIAGLDPDGSKEFLREILTSFGRSASSSIAQLADDLERNDYDRVLRTAHSLKGSSRQMGAFQLGNLCEALENAVNERRMSLALEIVANLKAEKTEVDRALDLVLRD